MKITLKDHTKLSNAVFGARICYNSFHLGGSYPEPTDEITDKDIKLLNRLLHQHGHYSVSRHIKYNFEVLVFFKNFPSMAILTKVNSPVTREESS